MTLEEARRLIQAELDGEIGAEQEAALQQRLADDEALRREYDEEKRLRALFRRDRESLRAPEGLPERVVDSVLARSGGDPVGRGRTLSFASVVRPLAYAASIAILVGGSFWAGSKTTTAAGDSLASEVQANMALLQDKYPGLDATEVEEIKTWYLEAHEGLEARFDDEKARLAREFEEKVGRLINEHEARESR